MVTEIQTVQLLAIGQAAGCDLAQKIFVGCTNAIVKSLGRFIDARVVCSDAARRLPVYPQSLVDGSARLIPDPDIGVGVRIWLCFPAASPYIGRVVCR